jgi:hypothetical protein
MSFAVALDAEDIFVLFLGERRVFGVDVFHYVCDFLGVQTSVVLEPHYPAMDAAVVAVGPNLSSNLLQQQALVPFFPLFVDLGAELVGEEFFLAVLAGLEDVGVGFGLEGEVGVVGVDDAQTAEEEVDFHDPVGVVAEVLADGVGGEVLLGCVREEYLQRTRRYRVLR